MQDRNPSLRSVTHECTQASFWAIHTHARLSPGTFLPTRDAPYRDTTSNAQCALRDSLGVSGRGSSPPRAAISRGAPRMFTHAERTSRVHGLGEGSREGWSFASPGWRLCLQEGSIDCGPRCLEKRKEDNSAN